MHHKIFPLLIHNSVILLGFWATTRNGRVHESLNFEDVPGLVAGIKKYTMSSISKSHFGTCHNAASLWRANCEHSVEPFCKLTRDLTLSFPDFG
jgi:hypothetical protein